MIILIIAILVMFGAAKLMERDDALGHIGTVVFGIAFVVLVFSVFRFKPVEASNGYPIAGVSEALSKMQAQAYLTAEPNEIEVVATPEVSEQDIELLARLITAEVGYSGAYDVATYEELCYLTGAVVLNRVADDDFSNNLYGVIYQPGQYACTWDGNLERPYDDIAWEIAEALLTYGADDVPSDLVWQAGFPQGETYKVIEGVYFGRK